MFRPRRLLGFCIVAMLLGPGVAFGRGKATKAAGASKVTGKVVAKGKKGAKVAKAPKAPKVPVEVPNQEGKIVVFPFKDDDDNSIGAQVERLLRARGLEVVTGVRPVDTAEQYREMAGALGLVAYVDGTFKEGKENVKVTVQVRSGYTGRRVVLATFKEAPVHLRNEIEEKLWTKVGGPMARACSDAAKPRKKGRGPLMIEAGTPLADTTSSSASAP